MFYILLFGSVFSEEKYLIPIAVAYFLGTFTIFAKGEARDILRFNNTVSRITLRFGDVKEYRLVPIGTTEKFIFGVECNKDLVEFRKQMGARDLVPVVRGLPFANITNIKIEKGQEQLKCGQESPKTS